MFILQFNNMFFIMCLLPLYFSACVMKLYSICLVLMFTQKFYSHYLKLFIIIITLSIIKITYFILLKFQNFSINKSIVFINVGLRLYK